MTTALHLGGESGWVSPFLGYGRRVWRLLQELPVDEVHPALHRVMSTTDGSPAGPENIYLEPLTERELTLLTLLPTHLSYAQMGDQLHLSVNTVKTNLKSIYRKLQADSRAAAVDAGKRAGLI